MITAVDTSVLLDVLRPNPSFVERSLALIETSATLGPLVLCDPVYAELAANFDRMDELDAFLADAGVRRESLNGSALFLSGRMWRAYRSAGGSRQRIISDFLVWRPRLRAGQSSGNPRSRVLPPLLRRSDRRRAVTGAVNRHPFTQTTCLRVWTTSTRSDESAMTASMSL